MFCINSVQQKQKSAIFGSRALSIQFLSCPLEHIVRHTVHSEYLAAFSDHSGLNEKFNLPVNSTGILFNELHLKVIELTCSCISECLSGTTLPHAALAIYFLQA